MALRLAEKGNDVIITYQSKKDAADAVVLEIENMGQKATAISLDTGNFDSLDHFIESIKSSIE